MSDFLFRQCEENPAWAANELDRQQERIKRLEAHQSILQSLEVITTLTTQLQEAREVAESFKSHAINLAAAIQAFRNLDLLHSAHDIRSSRQYAELCNIWDNFDDATEMKYRADLNNKP